MEAIERQAMAMNFYSGLNMSSLQYDPITHRIHGTGIFIYIHLNFVVNVGKYTIHGSFITQQGRLLQTFIISLLNRLICIRKEVMFFQFILTNIVTKLPFRKDPTSNEVPGDSKRPFHPLVGGHLIIEKGHVFTIPKKVHQQNCQVMYTTTTNIF